ncbi:quinolinate synthase NadA [Alkalihalophilus pseudofirmus]|uniref:Quinolinate synthase n=2 Tax=Alkalihalophilus pseudofirmus TaxID=79885 RepID=A0AAJ2NQH1_ALKPS|nr:quinolinate synthase NadA [Alkalihalophilus pseudofirmus]MDV2886608.1 quinolinate synthase NadA [Alkalihalophilus pseudofirmus]WEG17454.1 quinolinate synthase NadA [Alkalihalophilus pseudofirmus]
MLKMDLFSKAGPTIPAYYKQMSDQDLIKRASYIKSELGDTLFIPGHHYQKDEVIQFADVTGDSLQLARLSASNQTARYIVFCGVHFMAETADILTNDEQTVILPDMRAGCSMADMATKDQTEAAWEKLTDEFGDTIIPLTYVNSSAEIKAFVGRNGGATVTSSNAKAMLEWAFTKKKRILFLPDQHLGRNTAYELGIPLDEMVIWNQLTEEVEGSCKKDKVKMILWKGHCSVHEKFRLEHVHKIRAEEPERKIIVHPECTWDVVDASDDAGSTKYIIDQIKAAPKGTKWAIGTEMNLVNRLMNTHPDQSIRSLNPDMCPCLTMNRIDLPHFVWTLEQIAEEQPVNVIKVDEETAQSAKLAIERMFTCV